VAATTAMLSNCGQIFRGFGSGWGSGSD